MQLQWHQALAAAGCSVLQAIPTVEPHPQLVTTDGHRLADRAQSGGGHSQPSRDAFHASAMLRRDGCTMMRRDRHGAVRFDGYTLELSSAGQRRSDGDSRILELHALTLQRPVSRRSSVGHRPGSLLASLPIWRWIAKHSKRQAS